MKFKYKQIANGLGFGNILENILKSRGITNPKEFLNLGEHNVEDFNLFENMHTGVECLNKHIEQESKIVIVVDFDSDGYTSASELYLYLQRLSIYLNKNFTVDYIIHNEKAHGLTNDVMLQIEAGKYNLVLIPDAGSNDFKQHNTLHKNNIDCIVLDHHQLSEELLSDYKTTPAIIINNQLSPNITNKAMTGVGVTYKFCKALDSFYNVNFADDYLDLLAIGMIADSCDLTNLESRYLVIKGMNLIQLGLNKNKFITTIFKEKAYSMKNKVSIGNVAFYMSPFINCIIRGGDYETKVNLFKAFIGSSDRFTDKIRGRGEVELSVEEYMVRVYTKLKKLQDSETANGLELLSKQIEQYNLNKHEIIVVNAEELVNSNYNRVIVNKLSSKYHKHCILLKNNKGFIKGSASGYKNREITNLRQWCNDTKLFTFAEGHNMAFGCEIAYKNIQQLYDTIAKIESEDMLTYNVDAIITETTLNKSIIELVAKHNDIWGSGISEPLFAIENIIIDSETVELKGKTKNTIKFLYKGIEFMCFNTNEDTYNEIISNKQNKFTIICRFAINDYNNNITPQIVIEDWEFTRCEEVKKFRF